MGLPELAQKDDRIGVGSVVQINHTHGRNGWIGAFVLVTEVKTWGIQGFVQMIETHDKHGCAYIRLKWREIDYIGEAVLVPPDLEKSDESL